MLLTGGCIGQGITDALAAGEIDAMIQKPWDLHQLIERIRALAPPR